MISARHNLPFAIFGLMLIIVGFFGFLGGCMIYIGDGQWTSIFGNPTTLSAVSFNVLMGFAGGIIGAWLMTRDPFWMMSGALAGIFAAPPASTSTIRRSPSCLASVAA